MNYICACIEEALCCYKNALFFLSYLLLLIVIPLSQPKPVLSAGPWKQARLTWDFCTIRWTVTVHGWLLSFSNLNYFTGASGHQTFLATAAHM